MDLSTLTVASLTDRYNEMTGKSVKVGSYPKTKLISMIREIEDKFAGDLPITQPKAEEPEVDPMRPEESVHMVDDMGPLFPTEVEDPADLALDPLTFEEVPGGVGYPAPAEPTEEEALLADRLAKGECPFCGGDPANQTAAGEEGTFLGDSCNYCHTCDKTYNAITGVEVPTRDVKKRRILNPQGKIDAKEEALSTANFSLTYDRNSRLWTVASKIETEKNLWNMTSKQFAEFGPKEIVAAAETRIRPQA